MDWKKLYAVFLSISMITLYMAGILFFYYNSVAMSNAWLVVLMGMLYLTYLVGYDLWVAFRLLKNTNIGNSRFSIVNKLDSHWLTPIVHFFQAGLMLYAFLYSALYNYYQPFSLYDIVIYITLISWTIYILILLISSTSFIVLKVVKRNSLGKSKTKIFPGLTVTTLLLLLILPGVIVESYINQPIFNDSLSPTHLYSSGFEDYNTHRIPSLTVIPKGSSLFDGTLLTEDWLIVLAEGRRFSSIDQGHIDLVMRRSEDGGKTWSGLIVVQTSDASDPWKFGNPTPVFDYTNGMFLLLYNAQPVGGPYHTYLAFSEDGMKTWGPSTKIAEATLGPGHGTQMQFGTYKGRIIVPVNRGGSFALYSDNNGLRWETGNKVPNNNGNENEIIQIANGSLYMNMRVPIYLGGIHDPQHRLSSISNDGGETWSEVYTIYDLPTPICQASITYYNHSGKEAIIYASPAEYYSRSHLRVRVSLDQGKTFTSGLEVYAGPSGYSDLGVSSDGDLYLVFESGRVEYSDRITFVSIPFSNLIF